MPRRGPSERETNLQDNYEESAGPESGAMDAARRPQVVGNQDEDKGVGEQRYDGRFPEYKGERQARDRGSKHRNGGDVDESLMRARVAARAIGEKKRDGKKQDIGQPYDVEHMGIAAGRGVASQSVGGGHKAENNHQASEKKSRQAQAAMNIHASGGDQRSLRDEQQNPAGKHGAVQMNDAVGQRGAEESGKIIGVRETDEDGDEHDQRHARKEHMIVTATGRARSASAGPREFRSRGHSSPRAVRIAVAPEVVGEIVGVMAAAVNAGRGGDNGS